MLGGGGLLGSMYEIGCLAALERHAPDRRLTFDLYVGTSGGSVVASLLAAGYSATQLMEMVDAFSPANLSRLNLSVFLWASVRLPLQMTHKRRKTLVESRGAPHVQRVVSDLVDHGIHKID